MLKRVPVGWAAFLALGPLGLLMLIAQCSSPPSTGPSSATPLPPDAIGISIVTNDTKANWLKLVTEEFNTRAVRTTAGHRIVVEIIQEGKPEPTVQKIAAGQLQPTLWSPADMSWVRQANQQLAAQGGAVRVSETCPRIVLAATGFAMWEPMARALGWPEEPIGWREIAELAGAAEGWAKYGRPEWGQFKFGHSHPAESSTGFNLLASLAYAAAGKTAGLTAADVWSPGVVAAFRQLEQDTYHYGTSASSILNRMIDRGPAYLHAASSSEASFIYSVEHRGEEMQFPWVFIVPAEGVYWQDNPACLLEASWVSAEQREAAEHYRAYLLAEEQQDQAVQLGLRPAVAGVGLHCPICAATGTDPELGAGTVPALASVSGETHQAIIDVFKETKKKATVVLVLDRSGSMNGRKLNNAVNATSNFIARLDPKDRVGLTVFDAGIVSYGPVAEVERVRARLSSALSGIEAGTTTALNDAVCDGVTRAEAARMEDQVAGEQLLYGVIVLSDGIENASTRKDVSVCLPSGEDVEGVKVFTIAYGADADAKLLQDIADRTNGKTFSGNPETIEQVYLAISAEQ